MPLQPLTTLQTKLVFHCKFNVTRRVEIQLPEAHSAFNISLLLVMNDKGMGKQPTEHVNPLKQDGVLSYQGWADVTASCAVKPTPGCVR